MTVTYKGITIQHDVIGNGKPLVFLHGFLENSTMWTDTISFFSNHYRCITIDLLGHGLTGCLGYIHTMEDMANAVQAVLKHLEISKATLIGHSMGGYVALAYIDLFPESASGLVLLNSTALPDSEERKQNRARAIDIVKKNPNAYTSMAIANLFAEKNRSNFSDEINFIKNQASKTSLQGIISALEGMKNRKDRSAVLQNFKNPKIIFSGQYDPVLSYSQNQLEAQQHAIELVTFNGGHMTYIENREEYRSELRSFLSQIKA